MTEKEWLNPDEDEFEVVGHCAGCGYEIYKGDPIYRIFALDMIHADDPTCIAKYFIDYFELQEEVAE